MFFFIDNEFRDFNHCMASGKLRASCGVSMTDETSEDSSEEVHRMPTRREHLPPPFPSAKVWNLIIQDMRALMGEFIIGPLKTIFEIFISCYIINEIKITI